VLKGKRSPVPEEKRRALVLDDSDTARECIRAKLREYGFEVVVYDEAEAVLEHISEEGTEYEIFLFDIRLPGQALDGIELAKRVREFSETPVLFVTDTPSPETIRLVKRMGHTFDIIAKQDLTAGVLYNYCRALIHTNKTLVKVSRVEASQIRIEKKLEVLTPENIAGLVAAKQVAACLNDPGGVKAQTLNAVTPQSLLDAFNKSLMFRLTKWSMLLVLGGYAGFLFVTHQIAVANKERSIRTEERTKQVQKALEPLQRLPQAQQALSTKLDKFLAHIKKPRNP
jgi:DNA-binding response OmpR family regulator